MMHLSTTRTYPLARLFQCHSRQQIRSASSSASTAMDSNRETTTPTSPSLNVRLVHPRTHFREQMRLLRKQYQQEHQELMKQREEERKIQQQKEIQEKLEFEEKVRAYKAAKRLTGLESRGTTEDPMEELERKMSGYTSSNADGSKVQSKQPKQSTHLDAHKSRKDWPKFVQERREKRRLNRLANEAKVSKERIQNLLYLFHTSKDFVTPANIDDKISYALDNPLWSVDTDANTSGESDNREEEVLGILEDTGIIVHEDVKESTQLVN